jgi:hypothetical protein
VVTEYDLYKIIRTLDVCIEFELLKAKVPVIFLGTVGFSARRDGLYNADLIETCNREHNTIATRYIDDIAILRWGDTTEEICDGLSTTLGLAKQ